MGMGEGGLLGRQPKPLELLLPLYAHEGIAERCTAEEKPVRSDCIRALALVQPHLKRAAGRCRWKCCMDVAASKLYAARYVVCCILHVVRGVLGWRRS